MLEDNEEKKNISNKPNHALFQAPAVVETDTFTDVTCPIATVDAAKVFLTVGAAEVLYPTVAAGTRVEREVPPATADVYEIVNSLF